MAKWMVEAYQNIVTLALWIWVAAGAGLGFLVGRVLGEAITGTLMGACVFFFVGAVLFGAGLLLGDIREAVRALEEMAQKKISTVQSQSQGGTK